MARLWLSIVMGIFLTIVTALVVLVLMKFLFLILVAATMSVVIFGLLLKLR